MAVRFELKSSTFFGGGLYSRMWDMPRGTCSGVNVPISNTQVFSAEFDEKYLAEEQLKLSW